MVRERSFAAAQVGLCLCAALGVLPSSSARADEIRTASRCSGVHSLWAPVPDACLTAIDTDRPHQTDTPHVVPAGHSQFESAIVSVPLGGSLDSPSRDRSVRLVLFENNYKFGLLSRVDVQLLFKHAEYAAAARHFAPPGPLSVRAKFNIVDEQGRIPAVTLVPWVFLPVGPSQSLRGGPLVFLGCELSSRLELEVNTGMLFGARPKPPAALVLASALTYALGGDFKVFVDAYATGWDVALGTGALWAFARDMQIDCGTYVGLMGAEPAATPFVGFSIRR